VNYEFHASTAVVASLPTLRGVLPGTEVLVAASNDSGRTYGFPLQFRYIGTICLYFVSWWMIDGRLADALSPQSTEGDSSKMSVLASQMQNLHRAIANIQQMESDLRSQMGSLTNFKPKVSLLSESAQRHLFACDHPCLLDRVAMKVMPAPMASVMPTLASQL